MRIVFAGTPEFAVVALQALLAAGHDVSLVLTQPDRPAGRGMAIQTSPVKQLALKQGLPLLQPSSLKSGESRQPIIDAKADIMVVAAYGLILPQAALDIPRLGCVNIHASLLPRWRGAAPIQRALLAGDAETGVTIMRMEAGLDTGPMLLRESLAIEDGDTAATLHDKLAELGARLIVEALPRLECGELTGEIQPSDGVSYAPKLEKAEAALDWRRPAAELGRAVRAFNPFPGAFGQIDGQVIKFWRGEPVAGRGAPGTVLAAGVDGIVVACGEGALCLTELQKSGGKRLAAADFLHGFSLKPGQRLAIQAD